MRLALHPTGETGRRAGRILLAEPGLEALGIYGRRSAATEERRATAITDLAGFTVLASDDATAPFDLAAIAVADGLSCVLAADVTPDPALAGRFAAIGRSLLVAASLPGLAEALAHRAFGRGPGPDTCWSPGPGRGRRSAATWPCPSPPRSGPAGAPGSPRTRRMRPPRPGPRSRSPGPGPEPWPG